MYQFEYQHLLVVEEPVVACIVPEEWLTLGLPEMGGWVAYFGDKGGCATNIEFVCEFSEHDTASGTGRSFSLKIHSQSNLHSAHESYRAVFGKTISIRCPAEGNRTMQEMPAEIVLLNHLFCLFAGSAFTGASWVDIANLLQWLSQQLELILEYEIGSNSESMVGSIRARLTEGLLASSYAVIFGKDVAMKMLQLREMQDGLRAWIAYGPAVDQEQFLISALVSDKEFLDEMG